MAGEKKTYVLLGSTESDPDKGIISYISPLGCALIGKKIGDIFTVKLGSKEVGCKILEVE